MNFSVGASFNAMVKTWPFIVFRILIYFGVAVAYMTSIGMGAGLGYVLTLGAEEPGAGAGIGGLVGFGVAAGVLYWLREYILYLVKAGHIAVLGHVLDQTEIPEGQAQITFARQEVTKQFAESSSLFLLDQLIKGILRAFTRTVLTIGSVIPIPALQTLLRFGLKIVEVSLSYVDEIILSHIMRTKAENPWSAGRDALILYAQNYKTMVKNAVFLTVILYGLTFVLFLLILGPAGLLAAVMPGGAAWLTIFIAIAFAWAVKAAVLEPFAIACLMQVYFKEIEGQTPNPEWEAKLDQASDKFRELKDKALAYVAPAKSESPATPENADVPPVQSQPGS